MPGLRVLIAAALLFLSGARAADPPPALTLPAGSIHTRNILQLLERAADLRLPLRERDLAGRVLLSRGAIARPVLEQNLAGPGGSRRQAAAYLLGALGDPAAEPALLRAAVGRDWFAASQARRGLSALYARLDAKALTARLAGGEDSDAREAARDAALVALAADGSPQIAVSVIAPHLSASGVATRVAAARALARSRHRGAAAPLLERLSSETAPLVLEALARALARLRPAASGDPVLALTQHRNPRVQLAALQALHGLGYGGTVEGVQKFLTGSPAQPVPIRVLAAQALGSLRHIGPPIATGRPTHTARHPAVSPLLSALGDPAWSVRLAAVQALAELAVPDLDSRLQRLQRDPHPQVRAQAAALLAAQGLLGADRALLSDLQDQRDLSARREAASALGHMRCRRAAGPLAPLLTHPDLELACRAAEALGRIGEPASLSALAQRLDDTRPALAEAARRALQTLTGQDPGITSQAWEAWRRAHLPGRR